MRKLTWLVAPLCLWAMGCSGSGGGTTGISGTSGSSGATTGSNGFAIQELDLGDAGSTIYQPITAARSSDGRIGIAYYWDVDPGHRRLEYLEVDANGQKTRAVTVAASVQRTTEPAVAFDNQGDALVAYLGDDPASPDESMGLEDGGAYWQESDLALQVIPPSGAVPAPQYLVHLSNEAFFDPFATGKSPENFGYVVGLSPAIQILPDGRALIVYRDVHDGTTAGVQGFRSSDIEAVLGTPTAAAASWTHMMVVPGRDNTNSALNSHGLGAGTQLALHGDEVTLVCSGQQSNPYAGLYTTTYADGGWSTSGQQLYANFPTDIANNLGNGTAPTGGPRLTADPNAGLGMVWDDMSTDTLLYASSTDGVTWSTPRTVFVGTGGWFPNVAFDTSFNPPVPAVVYYLCSNTRNGTYGQCPNSALRLSELRPDQSWSNLVIDPEGGAWPYLFFDENQRPIVVYRSVATGGIRMAVQEGP